MAPPNQPQAQPARSGGTVTVACKYPAGLMLRLFEKKEKREASPNGFREFEQFEAILDPATEMPVTVAIKGPGGVPFGQGPALGVIVTQDGFALTQGVSEEFWERWLEQNKASDIVRNKVIYARKNDVEGWAREHAQVRTGVEPIDPDHPEKMMPGLGTMRVQKDDRK